MKKNDTTGARSLRDLAADLDEVYRLMDELCEQLQGGGIVQARDIEPSISKAVPKLRRAVATLTEASTRGSNGGEHGEVTKPSQSPLLM